MAWTQTGNLKGPKGDPGAQGVEGPQGPAGVDGARGPEGPRGPQGPQGPTGPQGPAGEDGRGITIAGSVPTYADLPANLTAADAGDGYLNEADGDLYLWSGSSFPAEGQGTDFVGPQGPTGPTGPQGPKGDTGATGAQGPKGDTGATGPKGDTGQRGTKWFTGVGAPGSLPGALAGDMYLDTTTGTYYELS